MIEAVGNGNVSDRRHLALAFSALDASESTWRIFCRRQPPGELTCLVPAVTAQEKSGTRPALLYLESSVNTALGSPRHKHLALSSHPFHLLECCSCAPTCCLGIFKREILLFGKIFICFFLFALLLFGYFCTECIICLCDFSEVTECLGIVGRSDIFRACFSLRLWCELSLFFFF